MREFLVSRLESDLAPCWSRVARPPCAGTYTAIDNALTEKVVWQATHRQLLNMFVYINYNISAFLILFDKFARIWKAYNSSSE